MEQDTEELYLKQIELNKQTMAEAEEAMTKMSMLRKKLHLNDGCGQRYLQKIQPDQASLEQAEKEIINNYSGKKGDNTRENTSNKKNLLKNLAQRNQA